MLIECSIINLFINNYNIYNKYYSIINKEFIKLNNKELYKIYSNIYYYYNNNDKQKTSLEDYQIFFFTQYPFMKGEEKYLVEVLFQKIASLDVKEDAIVGFLEAHLQRAKASEIANIAIDVADGKKPFLDLQTSFEGVDTNPADKMSYDFVTDDLEALYNNSLSKKGLRWRLNTLNRMLGSLRKGNFGFVFARPETGKTTFLASEVSHMAMQADGNVLWCNNEEDGNVVMQRIYQATLGVTDKELFANLHRSKENYYHQIQGRLKLYDNGGMTKQDVERLCHELDPKLIILDQIDKIKGFDADRYDLLMKKIYQWARELAKKYGPVIGVCQAGGTAEGKKYLVMTDVDSSHTAKQGEADWILGIGNEDNENMKFVRYFSICKNKLRGDEDTIPELRHGKCAVTIKPEIARYEDRQEF